MKELTLHARQKKLLSILNAKHGVETGKEISAKLGVSERTVRNDISEINAQLESYGIQVLPRYGKGYMLSIQDRAVYLSLFAEKESYFTKDDRTRTLLLRLIRENDWYDLGDLEDEMFVSRTTLENDIKAIKKRISVRYPYLQIQRQGNYIKFENDEMKKRALLIRLYVDNWDYDSRDGIVLKQDEFGQDILAQIKNTLKKVSSEWNVEMDDFSLIYMVLSMAVMHFRVKAGNPIYHIGAMKYKLEISEVIRETLAILSEEWKISFARTEYVWLSDIFYQLQILNIRDYTKADILKYTDISCQQIVMEILAQIRDDYHMDFTTDDRFFMDMTIHVQALQNGIIAPQLQNHVLGDELRNRYPFLGDIAHSFRLQLEERCKMDLWEDEEDYLLPFLISAQRTMYAEKRGKGITTVVISHLNKSLTHFLMEQLKKHYGDILDLRGPLPIHIRDRANKEHPLLILTTVRMKDFRRLFDVPVITVSALLEQEDRRQIEKFLTGVKCQFLYPQKPYPMQHYFRKDLVYRMKNRESLSSAIAMIQDKLYEKKYMIEKIAVDLENDYYTVLPNGFVFLYQIDAYAANTVISLVELERAISWKHVRNIRAIMFMALKPEDQHLLGWFYYFAFLLSEDAKLVSSMMEAETVEDMKMEG